MTHQPLKNYPGGEESISDTEDVSEEDWKRGLETEFFQRESNAKQTEEGATRRNGEARKKEAGIEQKGGEPNRKEGERLAKEEQEGRTRKRLMKEKREEEERRRIRKSTLRRVRDRGGAVARPKFADYWDNPKKFIIH